MACLSYASRKKRLTRQGYYDKSEEYKSLHI